MCEHNKFTSTTPNGDCGYLEAQTTQIQTWRLWSCWRTHTSLIMKQTKLEILELFKDMHATPKAHNITHIS